MASAKLRRRYVRRIRARWYLTEYWRYTDAQRQAERRKRFWQGMAGIKPPTR